MEFTRNEIAEAKGMHFYKSLHDTKLIFGNVVILTPINSVPVDLCLSRFCQSVDFDSFPGIIDLKKMFMCI